MQPPKAKKISHTHSIHGHDRIDNYYWMRDRENPDLLAHLEAENTFKEKALEDQDALKEEIFEEIKARFKPDDQSAPYLLKGFYYYHRFEKGKEYPFFCRRRGSMESEEEILLNVNELAEGESYCQIGGMALSKDHNLLAYGIDTQGRRIYKIRILNLETREYFEDEIEGTTGNMVWADDNEYLFYSLQDKETLRSDRIFRHKLHTDPAEDALIYEEKDDTFNCYISKSKSKKFLQISSNSTLVTETHILESKDPLGEFRCFHPREAKHEYSIDHVDDTFYILSNDQAENFRLLTCKEDQLGKENWVELIPHRSDVLLEDIEVFNEYLVLEERKGGLTQIRVMPAHEEEKAYYLEFNDPTYTSYLGFNPEANSQTLRYGYQSMTTPASVYEMDMDSKAQKLIKQTPVLGDFSSDQYASERLFATASDGTQVPISLVYKREFGKNERPLLLYAYGSYGYSMDPSFSLARLSLLNRGFVFAIAHIRGGSEMGRYWYDTGKMLKKKNTFTDFIACGDHLVKEGYTTKEKLFASGGSAGGLLMGAILNMRPELFKGVIANVPFVDVVTTMLDPDIPLTTGEYDEWGNPNEKEYYDYILSYSPYDNVEAKAYPHILVISGLHDSQVQYWEPTKWVAKLREYKTDTNLLLLHTNMEAGHSGASGRFEPYREVAMEYVFLLKVLLI
ncbi:MAG: S9 family peptidase [Bacteroidia bacterium]|nr:S9 family peptidase [Bacteroidia bacterium]